MPVFNINSETLLNLSKGLVIIVVILSLLIFILITIKRILLIYRAYRKTRFLNLWRPLLAETVVSIPQHLPALEHKFVHDFITEWNTLYIKLSGNAHDNLVALAKRYNIKEVAIKMLVSPHISIQLLGIVTLGNMQVSTAWPYIKNIADNKAFLISIVAYRALFQIDSDRAIEEVLPDLLDRTECPPTLVARLIKDNHNPRLCEILENSIPNASTAKLANIVRFLGAQRCENAAKIYNELLKQPVDDHIISLCLVEINHPSSIDLVRQFVDYPRWHVRVHAAHALGKIGGKEDLVYLLELLHDKQWWVRYRAAEAIINLPFISAEELQIIKNRLDVPSALEILEQVIAEKELR